MADLHALPSGRKRRAQTSGDGTGGEDWEARLRAVEDSLLVIETKFPDLATKEDLKDLKVWWLGGIIAGMASAAIITLAFLRIFSS